MRAWSILQDMKEETEYCSMEFFTNKYQISKRTIQSELSFLRKMGARYGFTIRQRRGRGYWLEITDESAYRSIQVARAGMTFLTPKDRPSYLLEELILNGDYQSTQALAFQMGVSESTARSDLNQVEKLAEEEGFLLERRSHYGVRLCGETSQRLAFMLKNYEQSPRLRRKIEAATSDFSSMESFIVERCNEAKLSINYPELEEISRYLRCVLYWAKENPSSRSVRLPGTDAHQRTLEKILQELETRYAICIDETLADDVLVKFYLAVRPTEVRVHALPATLDDLIHEFFSMLDTAYGTDFQKDEELYQFFTAHLSLLMDRLHHKISYKNPFMEELRITHPHVFNMALQFGELLHRRYGVQATLDELGFVAIHLAAHLERERDEKKRHYEKIAILCASSGGISYLLRMQLQSLFQGADIRGFSHQQQQEMYDFAPDLLFTMVPNQEAGSIPTIYIKELLTDRDLYHIKLLLGCDMEGQTTEISDPFYLRFFKEELFSVGRGSDYITMVRSMAENMVEKGYAKEEFTRWVLAREAYATTIYNHGVCIPHPLEICGRKNGIAVQMVRPPLKEGARFVRVIFLICLRKSQMDAYPLLSEMLYRLMNEPEALSELLAADRFEAMMGVLRML